MSRPEGFAWFNPGMPSLTVPYHDTNDFYYSGHVGTGTMYMIEFFLNGYNILGYMTVFVLVNQWVLLMLLRTHYIIDLVTGLLLGHWAMMSAEWISYVIDVKLLGWSAKQRKLGYHNPCEKCGWANTKVELAIDSRERKFLTKTSRIRNKIMESG